MLVRACSKFMGQRIIIAVLALGVLHRVVQVRDTLRT